MGDTVIHPILHTAPMWYLDQIIRTLFTRTGNAFIYYPKNMTSDQNNVLAKPRGYNTDQIRNRSVNMRE